MATLNQSPCFFTLSSRKIFLNQEEYKINWNTQNQHYPPQKHFRICVCEAKKSRGRRKVKSNVELCNDIRGFVAAAGFPEGHVPSMKELSNHGRNDLAHLVRRRGYKLIRDLLSNSIEAETEESNSKKSLAGGQGTIGDPVDVPTEGQDERVEDVIEDSPLSTQVPITQDLSGSAGINPECSASEHSEVSNMVEDNLSNEVLIMANSYSSLNGYQCLNSEIDTCMPVKSLVNSSSEEMALKNSIVPDEDNHMAENISLPAGVSNVEYSANDVNIVPCLKFAHHTCIPVNLAANSSLEDKVAKFIQNGDLDAIEDDVYGMLDGSTKEHEGVNKSENETEFQSKTPSEENFERAVSRSNAVLALNRSISTPKHILPPGRLNHPVRNNDLPAEGLASSNHKKDLDVETRKRENQVEIDHLKFMLHQKELELSRLKEQIEKEKLALSDLQLKAETEISKAQKLISEKDAELLTAEENLSGLVEVKIQYSGDGEIVEVAGSFNGWHERIKMDPQPSSSVADTGSRKCKLWSTMLLLYPGKYEIKFIVDGHWTIDPQRESVSRGGISNNILQVVG